MCTAEASYNLLRQRATSGFLRQVRYTPLQRITANQCLMTVVEFHSLVENINHDWKNDTLAGACCWHCIDQCL